MKKRVPRAEPQPWHAESAAAWDAFFERCKVGRAERRKIKERYANRFNAHKNTKK